MTIATRIALVPALVALTAVVACETTSSTTATSDTRGGVSGPPVGGGPEAPAEPTEPSVGFPPNHPQKIEIGGGTTTPGDPVDDVLLTSVDPGVGAATGGDIVVVRGEGFVDNATVTFGGAPSPLVFVIDDTWMNVTTPPGLPGPVDVRVILPSGAEDTLTEGFRYTADFSIAGISPAEGDAAGGDVVTVTGTGFVPGTHAMIGDRLAPITEVLSSTELRVTLPPGAPGLVDVRVVLIGEAVAGLDRAFRYRAAPVLDGIQPLSGPTVGGNELVVTGRYLSHATRLSVGESDAEITAVAPDGTWLRATAPASAAGRVPVAVATPDGEALRDDAYVYVGAGLPGVALWNAVPEEGPVAGGTPVTLVVTGLTGETPLVTFGTAPAQVVAVDAVAGLVTVIAPAGAPGPAQIKVSQGGVSDVLTAGFTYVTAPVLISLNPSSGSQGGGQLIFASGQGLAGAEVSVTVGGLPASETQVGSDSQLGFVAPPCSPGLLDVVVTVGGQSARLPDAFACRPDAFTVLAMDPAEAARSGGALVRLLGTGLPDDLEVRAGDRQLTVEWESPGVAWVRTARGDAGPVEVVVTSPSLGVESRLPGGLLLVNPEDRKVATWGALAEHSVNVTLVDGGSGAVLQGGMAIVGADPATALTCTTDDRGQCTVSARNLQGPFTVTGAKKQFSAYTIAGTSARNVTMFLRKQAPPGQQAPPGDPGELPPSVNINTLLGTISGRVVGLGKYVVPPPPSCGLVGSPDGQQCLPCSSNDQCAPDLACTTLLDTGAYCLRGCSSDDDCSTGYRCATVQGAPRCIPGGGQIKARCETSRRSFFGQNPDPGALADVNLDDGTYAIESRLGEVTVYCTAGYVAQPSGYFVPTIMGKATTVIVHLGEQIPDVDVVLDIPLTRLVRGRLFDLPEHEGGIGEIYLRHAIDLGAEGWIPVPDVPAFRQGQELMFLGFPENLDAFGPNASYTFYASVNASTNGDVPNSNRLLTEIKELDADPVVTRDAAGWRDGDTGMGFDLAAVATTPSGDLWAVGPKGRVVHRGPLGFGAQPKFTNADLWALSVQADDAMWAGGDAGTILRFDGAAWTQEPALVANGSGPVPWSVRGIVPTVAVGEGGVLLRDAASKTWQELPLLHAKGLYAVAMDGADVIAAGDAGKVVTRRGGDWSVELVDPDADWRAVAAYGGRVLLAGRNGAVALRDGEGSWRRSTVGARDWHAALALPSGELVLVGDAGAVARYDDVLELWESEPTQRDGLDLRGVAADADGLVAVGLASLPLGPWMAFPRPVNPQSNQLLLPSGVEWRFIGPDPGPTFNQLFMASSDGFNVWTVIADGKLTQVDLPPLEQFIDYTPIPSGSKYFNLTRGLNPSFSIDGYRFNQFTMWARTTWSLAFGGFY